MSGSSLLLEKLIRIIDRQGLLKGDLDYAQRTALMWLMDKEIEESTELEIAKIQSAALANHPGTQTDFLQTLFAEEDEESDEPMDEAHIVWTTPQTEEELEELNRYLDSI